MLVLEVDEVGLRRMTFSGDPVKGFELARRLKPWIEGLDAAVFCTSSKAQRGADRASRGPVDQAGAKKSAK